jgi:rubredoxin
MDDTVMKCLEKFSIQRQKAVNKEIIIGIQAIAIGNGLESKILLNEETILEVFEKQIPKRPYTLWDELDDSFYCPTCGKSIFLDGKNYCMNCGQKLDWSDNNG